MHQFPMIAFVLVGVVFCTICQGIEPVLDYSKPIPKGVPARVEIKLDADKETFLLGENILLHYEVKNAGTEPIVVELGGDSRAAPRHTRLHVIATDEASRKIDDPTPNPQHHGGPTGRFIIKPGETLVESVPLMRYCLFDKPGKYTIRIAHDLGWSGSSMEPKRKAIPDGDPRWASMQIELVMPSPDEAEQIVQTMLQSTDQGGPLGKKREPYGDFSCLRYPVYLPILQRLANNGELRAFEGMAGIPTVEATMAMVTYLSNADSKAADAAVTALLNRVPIASTTLEKQRRQWNPGQYDRQQGLANQCWRVEFAEPIMIYARKVLEMTPSEGMRDRRIEAVARLVGAVAPPDEMPTIIKALDRMLQRTEEVEQETPLYFGIIPGLQWAAQGILSRGGKVPEHPKSPGEITVYLEVLGRGSHNMARKEDQSTLPPEFETYARQWIDHPISYVQRLTIEALPSPCPDWAIEPLRTRLNDDDLGVQYAAINAVSGSGDKSFGPALLKLIRDADDQWVVAAASEATTKLEMARDELLLAWAERLDRIDHMDSFRTLSKLASLIEHQGSSGNSNGPPPTRAEQAALKNRWIKLITQHGEAIRAGKVFQVGDPEITPDLIPPHFSIGVASSNWPSPAGTR
jgi:hypothetical protein